MVTRNERDERELPCKDFDMLVGFAVEKPCVVNTNDYAIEYDDFEEEAWESTTSTDWQTAYEENHYTIPELLHELTVFIEKEMRVVEPCSGRGRELKRMLDDAQGWRQVDAYFEER